VETLILLAVVVGAIVFTIFLAGVVVTRFYRKVPQSQALIISRARSIEVTFTGALVKPVVDRAEMMDIGVKVIEVEKAGNDGLICRDNIRADIRVSFYVRVNNTAEDVRKVAQLVGCVNASTQSKLEELFGAKFAESLKTAGKQMDFVELYELRENFRTNVIGVIGEDLNGYVLDDVAIEYLEQTPIGQLDPNNVLDAVGIRKITDITSQEAVTANHFRREAEKQLKAKDVETQQAVYEMDRQEKSAEYRAQREMATTKAREESVAFQVEAEERLKAEQSRLKTDEQLAVQNENLQREVEVAQKNRERAVAVEAEKLEKARQLEAIARQVETTTAQRDLEVEKTQIAELARARVAADKAVAEQEEAILTLRRVEDANREKDSAVITAGGVAEAGLIQTIKAAEAEEKAAQHKSRELLTLAEADKASAELEAAAMAQRAEGTKAMSAAPGLAEVQVKRADAEAIQEVGFAQAKVAEANAEAARVAGHAEGEASEARLKGEAAGLVDKAAAMKELEGVGQEYDLEVKRIDLETSVRMASVEAQRDLGIKQAEAMAAALQTADIDIVGGTDMFVDRIMGASSAGKALEAFGNSSNGTKAMMEPYVNGDKDLVATVAAALGGLGPDGIAQLSLAQVLQLVAKRIGGDDGALLGELVSGMKDKGLDKIELSSLVK
jgi:uncharacterized membrane protein YqiK